MIRPSSVEMAEHVRATVNRNLAVLGLPLLPGPAQQLRRAAGHAKKLRDEGPGDVTPEQDRGSEP